MADAEDKKPVSYKLDGETFKTIKAKVDAHKAAIASVDTTQDELWETIAEFCPAVDPKSPKNHALNVQFEDHGIYFVKEVPECDCGMDHEAIARAFGAGKPMTVPPGITAGILRALRNVAKKD